MRGNPARAATIAALLGGAQAALAQAPQAPVPRMAASSFASVEVHVNARKYFGQWYQQDAQLYGPSRIAIIYGQPHARGRRVEGGLIPMDSVWRFGADMATTLRTDVDITIGDLRVPRGDYTLYVLYTRSGWYLIVNRETQQEGLERDSTKDMGRVSLASRALLEPEESLSVYLIPESADPATGQAALRGVLRIKWGTTELSTGWHVD
ncbi:MAG: DUF2911 domain-containing protein [Gemmatimonadales bacterium]|jgi:hypothetical protein